MSYGNKVMGDGNTKIQTAPKFVTLLFDYVKAQLQEKSLLARVKCLKKMSNIIAKGY